MWHSRTTLWNFEFQVPTWAVCSPLKRSAASECRRWPRSAFQCFAAPLGLLVDCCTTTGGVPARSSSCLNDHGVVAALFSRRPLHYCLKYESAVILLEHKPCCLLPRGISQNDLVSHASTGLAALVQPPKYRAFGNDRTTCHTIQFSRLRIMGGHHMRVSDYGRRFCHGTSLLFRYQWKVFYTYYRSFTRRSQQL